MTKEVWQQFVFDAVVEDDEPQIFDGDISDVPELGMPRNLFDGSGLCARVISLSRFEEEIGSWHDWDELTDRLDDIGTVLIAEDRPASSNSILCEYVIATRLRIASLFKRAGKDVWIVQDNDD